MSVVHSEFREHALAARITQGVLEHDAVRAHGAVVATLQLYPIDHAIADVFLPALRALERQAGSDARHAGARTIQVHVRQLVDGREIYPRSGAQVPGAARPRRRLRTPL